jgi:segregation and condensation protein B
MANSKNKGSAENRELMDDELGESTDSDSTVADDAIDSIDFELASFDSAEIEDVEELTQDEIISAVESLLFATDKPQSIATLKSAFQGTKVRSANIREALEKLKIEYINPLRGVTLEETSGGYQLRTKIENQKYLQRTVKARPFRLSGPALEVLSIVAYKQPCTKAMVDEVRGVESGHLMRGLLDRNLMSFAGKSELPGRPMLYETTKKFLEIFNLRNINELPSLSEIDQLIPEGIGETPEERQTLSDLTGELSTEIVAKTYSEGEDELLDISSELQTIQTSSEFFDNEKRRQKEKREAERAQDIQERLTIGEAVDEKDKRWLAKFELAKSTPATTEETAAPTEVSGEAPSSDPA